jgi:hypothetical protein
MTNQFFTNEHTSVLQKLVQEIVNDPSTYLGSKYLPSISMPTRKIRTEVIEASGGLTLEHVIGTDPAYVPNFGSRVQEFEPAAFKEKIKFDEKDILFLRELGQNDPSKAGIRQYIDKAIDRLNRRLEARIELLRWNALIHGTMQYMGGTFSYGIPGANRVVPVGAVWSSDGINANNSATPLQDIRYWLEGGYSPFRKYVVSKMIMNPNTARWFLDNSNVRSYLTAYGANPALPEYDINKVLQILIPGAPTVEIYKGWYQTESVVDGKVTVADATFMLPDGYIFFEVSNLPGGDMVGEFVQGIHLSSGSIENPGYGKFLLVEENIAPGTKGGPSNPYIDCLAGVYGGVKLDRPFDVLTAKVIS